MLLVVSFGNITGSVTSYVTDSVTSYITGSVTSNVTGSVIVVSLVTSLLVSLVTSLVVLLGNVIDSVAYTNIILYCYYHIVDMVLFIQYSLSVHWPMLLKKLQVDWLPPVNRYCSTFIMIAVSSVTCSAASCSAPNPSSTISP